MSKAGPSPNPRVTLKKAMLKLYRLIARRRVVERERLIVQPADADRPPPIFLIGLHRSGTTLLKQLVDSHSQIACPPETFFLKYFAELAEQSKAKRGLNDMGFDDLGIAQGLRRSAEHFYHAYAAAKGKPRWADKTPEYVMVLPFIERMFGPDAQYIMIYRHPFDVCQSLLQKGWVFIDYEDDPFLNVVKYVNDALHRQLQFQDEHPDRCYVVRYDQLMSDPEGAMKGLFEFVNEQWEPAVLEYHQFQHDFGKGDTEAQWLKGFRPSVGNWKRWTPQQIEIATGILKEPMDRLGYTTEL